MTLLSLSRSNDTRRISRRILTSISAGDVRPGQSLRAEVWAESLETTPAVVDAALGQLVAEGVLILGADRKPVLPRLSAARYGEMMLVRAELEGFAAAEAAKRATPRMIRELRSLHASMRAAESVKAWAAADRAFHFEIFEAAQLELLVEMIDKLWLASGPYMYAYMETPIRAAGGGDAMSAFTEAAEPLIAALERHNAIEARAAMAKRVMRAGDMVIANLRRREDAA